MLTEFLDIFLLHISIIVFGAIPPLIVLFKMYAWYKILIQRLDIIIDLLPKP